MAIDWSAFVKGWAGSAADSLKERDKEERDKKMMEDRAALAEKYQLAEEDRRAAREDAKAKKEVDKDRSTYDFATGEKVLVNSDGAEIGRVKDPTIGEDRTWTKEQRELARRQAEASIGASNRSGRERGGDADTPTDKNRNRVEGVLKNIDARLEEFGAPPAERLAARQAVLKKVAGGQSIDQAWLDRYESSLVSGLQKSNKLDQWGAEKIKRDAAAAAMKTP